MKWLDDSVPLWLVILVILIAVISLSVMVFFLSDNQKLSALLGGAVGGMLVYIANFISETWALRQVAKFQAMGVKNVLANRHDKIYYRRVLANASRDVKVMGASCSRFIDDFLDPDSDDRILIDRLQQCPSLSVQLLIPDDCNINSEAQDRFNLVADKLTKIDVRFKGRVGLRRFSHKARHSFVISDDDLIAGPIFAEERSKHAPAVHVKTSTPFGEKYLEYFKWTWEQSQTVRSHEINC